MTEVVRQAAAAVDLFMSGLVAAAAVLTAYLLWARVRLRRLARASAGEFWAQARAIRAVAAELMAALGR